MAAGHIKVWDRPVRLLHWVLVVAVLMAWITTLTAFSAHQAAGYVALAAVLLRAVWGCVGSRYARFAQFVRPPRATLAYAHATLRKREPRKRFRYVPPAPLLGPQASSICGTGP